MSLSHGTSTERWLPWVAGAGAVVALYEIATLRAKVKSLEAAAAAVGRGGAGVTTVTAGTAVASSPTLPAQVKRAPVVVQADNLRAAVFDVVRAGGSSAAEAHAVSSNLVLSNLKGHDSHGVGYLPRYIKGVKSGMIKLDAVAAVVHETDTTMLLDGGIGFGQTLGLQAMAAGIPKALKHGVAIVSMRNSHHLGRIGAWAEQCADAGLVSIHFTNVAGHHPLVAPHLGSEARLGTNPFTVGFPGQNGEHIVLDYATSEQALGKVREALARGEPVPDGVLLDKHGMPTNDSRCLPPNDGCLLPFCGHKGYALALMCEIIGAAMTGAYTIEPSHPRDASIIVNSMTSLIFNPAYLTGADGMHAMHAEMMRLFTYVRSSPLRPGADPTKQVIVPGQYERNIMAKRNQEGIPVAAGTYDQLKDTAVKVGLSEGDFHARMKGTKK